MLSKKFFALGASRHDDLQDEAVHAAGDSTHHNIAAEATAILAHMEESETMDSRPEFYAVPLHEDSQRHPVETAYPSGGSDTFYTHARGSIASTPVRDRRGPALRSAPRAPISAGAVAGLASLVIGGIAAFVLLSGRASVGGNDAGAVSLSAATRAIAAPATSATGSVQPANTLLFDALSVGATSPRGTSANGVTAARALENANLQLLASGAARDTEEGAFWLKQYITGTFADDRTMRVLTQLGSVYAEPSMGTPDYAKARLLWEISSAAGDPVAMCFLGLLHESGLGVTADRTSALRWYERSKDKGGCPNVDESLARVRQ